MASKEELYYLVLNFYHGKYDVSTFSDEFTRLYSHELDYDTMTDDEKNAFNELCSITTRFSPYEEDLRIPNVYFSEFQVRRKVQETIERLKIKV